MTCLAAGAEVAGPVTVIGADTGFTPILVSGNTIRGPLTCHDNTPAPTDENVPNSVTGPTRGQCRDL